MGENRSPDGMRCTLPSYRRSWMAQEIKETGNEEGKHCCSKGDEEFCSTEVDDWFGPGRIAKSAFQNSHQTSKRDQLVRRRAYAMLTSPAAGWFSNVG